MTCSEIMTSDPVTVREEEPVATATAILRDNHFRSVPVVNEDGKMVGQFGIQALLGLILPKAAAAQDGLSNLRYLNDDLADLQRRLVEEHDQPVGKYAEAVGPVLHPDTAISQVVVHLTESRNNLPVVDEASGKLVGMVSYWDIIGRILGDK
jgi:CBS-domain-containing membrane protein